MGLQALQNNSPHLDCPTARRKAGNFTFVYCGPFHSSCLQTPTHMTPEEAKAQLDNQVRETIQWHFSPETGCPFWL
jgi:hypothetical protein